MTAAETRDIWVFIDLRSTRLFEFSLGVLCKARELAAAGGGGTTAVILAPAEAALRTRADAEACVLAPSAEAECLRHGAGRVLTLQNDRFAPARPDLFAAVLAEAVAAEKPRLVLAALTDFGRELAALAAGRCRAGLIADCKDIRVENGGRVVGVCPAWGGRILAEITYADGWGTGFATVQPHGCRPQPVDAPHGDVIRRPVAGPALPSGLRLTESRPAPASQRRLENAEVVVVGGAGLGSARAFGKVRELAAALGGQVGATRPPVLQHWVDEERMIGQTGKRIAPRLLVSIGTSGAAQYTAGIMEAGTIVAINRDPDAPMFQLADIGIVADANEFLPLLIERAQQALMRRLADVLCETGGAAGDGAGFGAKLRKLREGRDWSIEALAEATGQNPDFIQQVESDEIAPPVGFLLRLAAALNVDPGTFLRKEEQAAIRDRRLESYVRRTQNYSYQTLTEGSASDHLRAFMVTIEPHHTHKPVAYKHEGEEFIFVMSGELELTLGRKAIVLKPGEHIHFNSFTPHRLKNLSNEHTRLLVVLYTL
jgi:electron transfer flavoprotein alpha subunit/transcriptional regulator with XRE-family HTH domain